MFEVLTIVGVLAVLINLIETPLRQARQPVRSMALGALGCLCLASGVWSAGHLMWSSNNDSPWLRSASAQEASVKPADVEPADGATQIEAAAEPATATEQPGAEQPTVERPIVEQPDTEQPAADDAANGQAAQPVLVERPAASDGSHETTAKSPDNFILKRPTVEVPYGQRPAWVGQPLNLDGSVHSVSVVAGPTFHEHECKRALNEEKQRAVAQYINEFVGHSHASKLISYDLAYINQHLVKNENVYDEVVTVSFGPMHQMHAKLEFDQDFQADVNEQWRQVVATSRLAQTGVGVGGILGLLALVFSYFKLDSRTRGFYTGRLQFMAALAVLGLLGVGAVAFKWWIPWI